MRAAWGDTEEDVHVVIARGNSKMADFETLAMVRCCCSPPSLCRRSTVHFITPTVYVRKMLRTTQPEKQTPNPTLLCSPKAPSGWGLTFVFRMTPTRLTVKARLTVGQ